VKPATLVLVFSAICLVTSGCANSSSGNGTSLGVPPLLPIVRDAAPSALKGSRYSDRSSGCFTSGGTASDIFTCLKDRVLSESPVEGPTAAQWYLRYVKELDERVSVITTGTSACATQAAVAVPLDLSSGITNMPAETFSLQCEYPYTQMPSGWTGSFAYGTEGDTITLVSRMYSSDGGFTVLAGNVDKAGTTAKIWFFGAYLSGGDLKYLVVRLLANKTTGAFAYNWLASNALNTDNNELDFCDFYLRSNGSDSLRIAANPGLSAACNTLSTFDFDSGLGGTQAACVSPTDLDTAGVALTCTEMATFPEGGPGDTDVFDSSHLNKSAFGTTLAAFGELDFATLGVGSN